MKNRFITDYHSLRVTTRVGHKVDRDNNKIVGRLIDLVNPFR